MTAVATVGLLGYAAYLPTWRLDLGSTGRSRRVVAAYDEDSTTMAVEAARRVLAVAPQAAVTSLQLGTSSPAYLDKTNAVAVHAALGLAPDVAASDAGGTARSTMAALRAAVTLGGLVAAADVRVGRPGSADETGGADAAAAVLFGPPSESTPALAEVLAQAARSNEFLDRWRDPARTTGEHWEERFGFERYAALVRHVAAATLDAAGLDEVDHVVVTSPNAAVGKRVGALVKGRLSTNGAPVGFAGAADPLLALAAALDAAQAGETILLVSAADGCDAVALRATAALHAQRQRRPVAAQLANGRVVPYTTYLAWRGLLEVEPPRRPEPDRPAAPPAARGAAWKYALAGSRCRACGLVHLPPARVCRECGALDDMEPVPMAGRTGRVATYTVDRLAYSPSPPVVEVVVDVDGGGRSTFELADPAPETLAVGLPVEFVFRRLFTAGGVHNYFWKAHALHTASEEE